MIKVYLKSFWLRFFLLLVAASAFLFSSCTNQQGKKHTTYHLQKNWRVQRAALVSVGGSKISSLHYRPEKWYSARVPSTIMHVLISNGLYLNIFRDKNIQKVPDSLFSGPWWYRRIFSLENVSDAVLLRLEGINYKANVWVNGKKIADTATLFNAFRQFKLNITKVVHRGKNVLAVEVFPPKAGDFSIGFVDWNPKPPDKNMGLFRGVYLESYTTAGIDHPFVVASMENNNTLARLTASAEVTNFKNQPFQGTILLQINGQTIKKPISLNAGETKKIMLRFQDYPALVVKNPRLWWPSSLGTPHLYEAHFALQTNGKTIDKKTIHFGIRQIASYFTKNGFRGFMINGEKILIRGGGWVDHLFLDDSPDEIRSQLAYVQAMNLNTIRLEGFWGTDQTLYHLADSMGIMVMVGWSCQWEWEDYLGKPTDETYGGILTQPEINMMSQAWHDQIVWLRNHPSVITWFGGSDCIPKPSLEKKYLHTLSLFDSTRVYLASAKEWKSLAGPTGVKMRGPYAYEPPVYWFADTAYGGAFGFNTETGPGAQVPPLESIKKMISGKHLWPIDSVWNFHCGRNEFNTLERYNRALQSRYGKATSVQDYARKAQLMNYELMRPMFEAFSAHRYKATGVIQWMLNSAWPEMYWQLYDYYLMPNGAFYGTQEALRPRHVLYDYARHAVRVVNDWLAPKHHYSVSIKVYDNRSKMKFHKTISVDLPANESHEIFKLPRFRWNAPLYFLDLRLFDEQGQEIDHNFYWLSAKKDLLDYKAKVAGWYYYTPSKQYADFTALNRLPKVKITAKWNKTMGKIFTTFRITLKNESPAIAFFVHPAIKDRLSGTTILPVLWSANDVSLLPGEKRTLTARIRNKQLKNKKPVLKIGAYNLETE